MLKIHYISRIFNNLLLKTLLRLTLSEMLRIFLDLGNLYGVYTYIL